MKELLTVLRWRKGKDLEASTSRRNAPFLHRKGGKNETVTGIFEALKTMYLYNLQLLNVLNWWWVS
jgi:hypothetical protein